MAKKHNKKKGSFGLVRIIILVICGIVFFGSLAYIGMYAMDKMGAQNSFKVLSEEKKDLKSLWNQNNDFVGWLTVDGTKIDYPVMQTVDDPEFYLHKDFNKEYSESGTPFIDATSVVYGDGRTWNWLIYGHNMKFGTMFHDLLEFDDKEFWEQHKTFELSVIYPEQNAGDFGEYEIVVAAYSRIYEKDSDAFKYYSYTCYTDESTFNEFVEGIKKESVYDTGITPQYGDQLVTLSTCAYHTTEGRFYVVGRKIK
mgnify:FL=1